MNNAGIGVRQVQQANALGAAAATNAALGVGVGGVNAAAAAAQNQLLQQRLQQQRQLQQQQNLQNQQLLVRFVWTKSCAFSYVFSFVRHTGTIVAVAC